MGWDGLDLDWIGFSLHMIYPNTKDKPHSSVGSILSLFKIEVTLKLTNCKPWPSYLHASPPSSFWVPTSFLDFPLCAMQIAVAA